MTIVDVVVVTYNSRDHARACVAPLCADPRINVVVVDNASTDGTPETLRDLSLGLVQSPSNDGFATACNRGWRTGAAPYVLFLNPDARISADDVVALAKTIDNDPGVGAAGPLISEATGEIQPSQRLFPSLSATFARAFFLHRLFPRSRLSFDIGDPSAYEVQASPDWLSGACLAVRRTLLEELGGFDERFFMYCEDMDLCKRVRESGYDVVYDPQAHALHVGAASSPRARLVAVMTSSRLLYAAKHRSRTGYWAERLAIGLDALTHLVFTSLGREARSGYAKSLHIIFSGPVRHDARAPRGPVEAPE